jgi:hypothetical protein
MARFTIKPQDQIIVICRHKGEVIEKCRYFDYKSIKEIKERLASLPIEFKNTGRRIELTFYNQTRNVYKFIDTFS